MFFFVSEKNLLCTPNADTSFFFKKMEQLNDFTSLQPSWSCGSSYMMSFASEYILVKRYEHDKNKIFLS